MTGTANGDSNHPRAQQQRREDQRAFDRYALDNLVGTLIYKGAVLPCQFIDISVGGCCVRTDRPFADGALADVKVNLKIDGISLRVSGTTQRVTEDHVVGIRFDHPSPSSRNQLAALLTCLIDKDATETIRAAIASSPSDLFSQFRLTAEAPVSTNAFPSTAAPLPSAPHATQSLDASAGSEMPASFEEDWPALMTVLKDNLHLSGVIRGLYREGCEFHTLHPYKGGLNLNVEIWFQMRKLPFQLPGVTDFLIDEYAVGIRFLQLSERKRKDLDLVVEEIGELEKKLGREKAADGTS